MIELTKALIQTLVFIEFSSEDIMDPDQAVLLLEEVAFTLEGMDGDGRNIFFSHIEIIASEYRSEDQNEIAHFIETIPQDFGLV